MGALCSGKSENPAGIESHRPNIRANAIGSAPKVDYSIKKEELEKAVSNNANKNI